MRSVRQCSRDAGSRDTCDPTFSRLSVRLIMPGVHAISTLRAVVAVAISLWIAIAACVFGCLPAIARSAKQAPLCRTNSLEPQGADCCHRESPSNPAGGKRPSPNPSASCCPTEAALTLVQKWQPALLTAALSVGVSPESPVEIDFSYGPFSDEQVSGTGRDTLQKMHVLRI